MISVIIPTFNEEENIAQCLVSLRHQTVRPPPSCACVLAARRRGSFIPTGSPEL